MSDRDQRITFSLLWVFALFNYTYADIGMLFSMFVYPGALERLLRGLGGGAMTDAFFLGGAILMEIGFAAILLSWLASHRIARWTNIGIGMLFTLVILAILFASGRPPPLNYYTFYEAIEVATTAYIVWRAWKWRPASA
jgi:hypothetical protein